MKSVDRFFHRYILSSIGILVLYFAINLFLIGFILLTIYFNGPRDSSFSIEAFSKLIEEENGTITSDPQVQSILERANAWAMLLNEDGAVIWQNNLPEDLPRKYSISDVATFSRWYLQDYPVKIWNYSEGLLVVGFQPGTVIQYHTSLKAKYLPSLLGGGILLLIINSGFIIFLFLKNTKKIEIAMKPILAGIKEMSQGQILHLEEKGELSEINASLNHASAYLSKKDNTRAEWIRGISHDIRTPLSMILGYSSEIEDHAGLADDIKKQAGIIRKQGEKLRTLISDLNLTAMLEYSMQPLRIQSLNPSELVRQAVSEFLNNGLPEIFKITIFEPTSHTSKQIYGDTALLYRMIRNLIQNSITHNPEGCQITVSAETNAAACIFRIIDTGCGINETYLESLNQNTNIPSSQDISLDSEHGLGLKIVRQIVKLHRGTLFFSSTIPHGLHVEISIPINCRTSSEAMP